MKRLIKLRRRLAVLLISVVLICLLVGYPCHADVTDQNDFRHEMIVVFPIYAEEILLQMVEPTDLIFVGHEYWDNASEYYPTMELTRDIPGRLYTNMDLHDLFTLDRKPTLIIVDDYLQLAYEHQYGDIPEIVNGQVRTVYVKTPGSIKDIIDLFQQLGEAVHAEGQAEKMTVEFMAEYDQICKAFSELDLKQPVTAMYYEHFQDSFPLLSEICGLINIYEGMDWVNDERFQEASVLNPDIIFYCPVEFDSDGSILSISQKYSSMCREIIIQEPFLQDTNAAQNDRIYPLFLHQSQYILDDAWYVLSLLKNPEM